MSRINEKLNHSQSSWVNWHSRPFGVTAPQAKTANNKVVFEQVGEGYLKQGQLVGEDLEVAAAAAVGEGLPEGHFKNTILSSAISLAIFSFSASASLLNAI